MAALEERQVVNAAVTWLSAVSTGTQADRIEAEACLLEATRALCEREKIERAMDA